MENRNKPLRLSKPKEFAKSFDKMISVLEAQFGYKIRVNEINVGSQEKATSYNVKFIKSNN